MTETHSPAELLADGQLRDAIDRQRTIVTRNPRDAAAGLFLFELLAVAGLTEDAVTVLKAIPSDDASWKPAFRRLLLANEKRQAGKRPQSPGDVPDYVTALRQATVALQKGDTERAIRAIDKANDLAHEIRGTIDGEPFEGLRDSDDRTAFVIEFLCDGQFIWVPFAAIRSLKLDEPAGPLDGSFRPALIRLTTGESIVGHLPMIYAGTSLDRHDESLVLGLDTDYDSSGDVMIGIGGRTWLIGDEMVDVSTIKMLEIAGPARVGLM